jgi:hypothetical protein
MMANDGLDAVVNPNANDPVFADGQGHIAHGLWPNA